MEIKQICRKLLILNVFCSCILSTFTTANKCKIVIADLKESHIMFVEHIMANVAFEKFSMCNYSYDAYKNMMKFYENVKSNCSQFIGDNPVDIIRSVTTGLAKIWDKAYCDDCFVDDKNTVIPDKNAKFENCYATNLENNEFCLTCLSLYEDLNSYYTNIDLKNKGKVCYDLHYMVNATRIKWSVCSKHEGNLFLFILATAFVSCLPIIFYGVNILLTKRNERNHGVLYDRETEHRINNTLSTPFTNTTATATPTTTTVEPIEETTVEDNNDVERSAFQTLPTKKLIDINDDEDDYLSSDDEALLPKKIA